MVSADAVAPGFSANYLMWGRYPNVSDVKNESIFTRYPGQFKLPWGDLGEGGSVGGI